MASRKNLLDNLLRVLVNEWGQEQVEAALTQLSNEPRGSATALSSSSEKNKQTRVPAREQVLRARLPKEQEAILLTLAERFERKEFLPSVPDVREFLIMIGERPGGIKDRSAAFRILLKTLSTLPVERLEQFSDRALHSGPSQLGPLSEAISAVAASRERNHH